MLSDKHVKQHKRNRTIKRVALGVGLLLAIIIGTIVGYYGNQISEFLADVSNETPDDMQSTDEQEEILRDLHPISILLLGIDATEEPRRSDTMIVATINPEDESVKLVSIPRDTLITLPDSDRLEKVNAVYPIYGISGVVDFVSEYLQIPISFYATLNFQGLVDLVDAVGGISVDSPLSFTVQDSEENSEAIVIEEGVQQLDGEHALGYARMRKQDPRGDFGRQERQREVIQSLANELLSFSSLTNVTPILNAIRPNLQTNMTPQQILFVSSNYSSSARNIESLEMAGQADYVYVPSYGQELYVWLPYENTLRDIQESLQEHMELDEIMTDDSVDYHTIEGGPDEEEENVMPTEEDEVIQ